MLYIYMYIIIHVCDQWIQWMRLGTSGYFRHLQFHTLQSTWHPTAISPGVAGAAGSGGVSFGASTCDNT